MRSVMDEEMLPCLVLESSLRIHRKNTGQGAKEGNFLGFIFLCEGHEEPNMRKK